MVRLKEKGIILSDCRLNWQVQWFTFYINKCSILFLFGGSTYSIECNFVSIFSTHILFWWTIFYDIGGFDNPISTLIWVIPRVPERKVLPARHGDLRNLPPAEGHHGGQTDHPQVWWWFIYYSIDRKKSEIGTKGNSKREGGGGGCSRADFNWIISQILNQIKEAKRIP